MAVELVVDTLDGVDEAVRGAYVEKDGKHVLDPDKYSEFRAQGLKNKNQELLGKLTAAKTATKRYEILGDVEDDDIADFSEWLKTRGQDNGNGKPKSTDLQRQLDKATQKHGTLEKQIAELNAENKHFKLTVPLREIAIKSGVRPEDIDLAILDTQKRFALTDDNKIVVLDEDGDPTTITPQKFFESLYKEQRPNLYRPSGGAGSGASANTGGGASGKRTITRAMYDAMSHADRGAIDWKATAITD